ncbi:hypothetical protein PM082_022360 [Marasmius tenuissimus]|nr:hypothetical protein PM082_022360 [Marasmius tenuissimus]
MSESVFHEWNWQTSFNFTLHEEDQRAPGSPPQAQDGHDHDITEHSDHLHLSSPLSPTNQLDHPDEDMDCRFDFGSTSTSTLEEYDHRIRDMNRLASLERNYYSTFFCCALKLPSFHALLEHIERVHVTVIHGMRYYRPVGAITGTTLTTPTYQHHHDEDEDMEEETSQGWQWPWYSPGEFMFGKEPQVDLGLGLESDEDEPGAPPPSSSTAILASLTPTPTPTASTSSSPTTTTSTFISPSNLNPAVPTNATLPSPSPRSPIPPLSLSIPVCSGARPNSGTRVRGIADDSDSDNDSDSLNASTPSLSPSASPSRSPSPSPSPTTPTASISPVSLMGTTSLLLPTPPLSPSSAGMNTSYSELEEWKVSKPHVSYHTHPHAHAHTHSYPNPHSHKFPQHKKHTHGHGHQRRKMKAHHSHNRDEGRYRYRCPTVGCVKAYLNPNGLKYHREKGKCAFE